MIKEPLVEITAKFLVAELKFRSIPQEPTLAWSHAEAQYREARAALAEAVWAAQS